MKRIIMVMVLVMIMATSGMAVAEGDQIYGTMSRNCSECAECTDVMDAMENLPFAQFDAQFDAMSDDVSNMEATATTSGITIEEEWEYGRRNVVLEGMDHVYYDFEEGNNLFPFNNVHPGVTSFENVSDSYCCWPCSDNNEPSYVRQGANSGPNCHCIMYIYPTSRKFTNGTDIPYIHVVNGNAAFAPRVLSSWCYYPACSAFIGFKDGTNYVSFLASTGGNLRVRAYDKTGGYLGGTMIYYTTDRIGDGPSNFTRFTMHLPGVAIGYLTFDGPFNGWHIDDLVVGDTPGYLPDEGRRNYDWAADRMKTLVGAKYHELGLGYILETGTYITADAIKDPNGYPIWDPFSNTMLLEEGICPEAAIVWAFNEHENLVNNLYANDQRKKDFKEEIAYEDVQPGDVYFIDYPPADGIVDEVGMFVDTGTPGDIVRVKPTEGVCYDSSQWMEDMRISEPTAIVDYRSLPDIPRGPKSPYPKPPREPKI